MTSLVWQGPSQDEFHSTADTCYCLSTYGVNKAGSGDCTVTVVTTGESDFDYWQEEGFVSSLKHLHRLCFPPSLLFKGNRELSVRCYMTTQLHVILLGMSSLYLYCRICPHGVNRLECTFISRAGSTVCTRTSLPYLERTFCRLNCIDMTYIRSGIYCVMAG